ncbi:MAG TPA: anti-sigma factor antagonist [Campylobacterales bacterium]|nr:anti-sigma factor antagonist [Campylobacterales bacterium]
MVINMLGSKKKLEIMIDEKRLDISNMREVKAKILKDIAVSKEDIVINCSKIEFLDSSGLSVIMAVFKQLNSQKRKLILCSLNRQPQELMKITQLHKIFTINNSC